MNADGAKQLLNIHPGRRIINAPMYNAKAYSAASATSPLASTTIARRDPTETDVQIEILFCGICHSDLHQVRNEWSDVMPTVYPCVPGHEIVGRVTKVGSAVTKFKAGDLAAVGCMVDSDGTCPDCKAGPGAVLPQPHPHLQLPRQAHRRRHLRRLLRQHRRRRALRAAGSRRTSTWPERRRCSARASRPIRRCTTGTSAKGKKVGIVGLGGLGHMGVKFAHALGAHVGRLHHLARQNGGRAAARRRRGRRLARRRTRWRSTPAASTSSWTACRADHDINAYSTCSRRDGNLYAGRRAGEAASRVARSI